MRKFGAACLLILASTFLAPACLAASGPQDIPTPFDADGYSVLADTNPHDCLVGSDINLTTMLERTKDLQSKGLIREDVNAAHVKAHAWTTASAIALKLEPLLIVQVYKNNPEIDRCGFVQVITGFNGQHEAAFKFDMTRAIYNKTNWPDFSPQDLPDTVEGFTIGAATAGHMNAENKP